MFKLLLFVIVVAYLIEVPIWYLLAVGVVYIGTVLALDTFLNKRKPPSGVLRDLP
jgi:hypothetical protein